MQAILSLRGIYLNDCRLFNLLQLPESVSRETVINRLLMESACFEVCYPDFTWLYHAFGVISTSKKYKWDTLAKSIDFDYNPIENYNRFEDWTDDSKRDTINTEKLEERNDNKGNTEDNNTAHSITVGEVSAFNSSDFENRDRSTTDSTGNLKHDETYKLRHNAESVGTVDDTGKLVHSGNIHGNIGVMSTQQMIEQERKVAEFDVVGVIVQDIIDYVCVKIY